jgi:hypothetical protein
VKKPSDAAVGVSGVTATLVERAEVVCLLTAGGMKAASVYQQHQQRRQQQHIAAQGSRSQATAGVVASHQHHAPLQPPVHAIGWLADGALFGALTMNAILRHTNKDDRGRNQNQNRNQNNIVPVPVLSPAAIDDSRPFSALNSTAPRATPFEGSHFEGSFNALSSALDLQHTMEKAALEKAKVAKQDADASRAEAELANARAAAAERMAEDARDLQLSVEAEALSRAHTAKREANASRAEAEFATRALETEVAAANARAATAKEAAETARQRVAAAEEEMAAAKECSLDASAAAAVSLDGDVVGGRMEMNLSHSLISRVRSRAKNLAENLAASREEAAAAAEAAIRAAAAVPIRGGGTRISTGRERDWDQYWDMEGVEGTTSEGAAASDSIHLNAAARKGTEERDAMDRAVAMEIAALEKADRAEQVASAAKAEAESARVEVAAANARAAAAEEMAEAARERSEAAEERSLETAARFSEEAERCASSARNLAEQSDRLMQQDSAGVGADEWCSVDEVSFRRTTTTTTTTRGGHSATGGAAAANGGGGSSDGAKEDTRPPPLPVTHHELGPALERQTLRSLRATEKPRTKPETATMTEEEVIARRQYVAQLRRTVAVGKGDGGVGVVRTSDGGIDGDVCTDSGGGGGGGSGGFFSDLSWNGAPAPEEAEGSEGQRWSVDARGGYGATPWRKGSGAGDSSGGGTEVHSGGAQLDPLEGDADDARNPGAGQAGASDWEQCR